MSKGSAGTNRAAARPSTSPARTPRPASTPEPASSTAAAKTAAKPSPAKPSPAKSGAAESGAAKSTAAKSTAVESAGVAAGGEVAAGGSARPVAWTVQILVLGLVWLGTLLYGTWASIGSAQAATDAVDWTSIALPGVIGATLLGGACVGTFLVNLALRRWPALATWRRWVAGIAPGAVVGAIVGALAIAAYGHQGPILWLAAAVLVAGALGGVLAGLPQRSVVVAGVAATLAVFLVEFAIQVFQAPLRELFGGSSSGVSQWNAGTRLAVTEALVGGVAAGLVAFVYLRRSGTPARMASYLSAGALPGLVLLAAEAVTRIVGRQVFAAVAGLSEGDRVLLDYWKNSRLNQALVVLFVGAIVALICFGRTLPKRRRRR